MASVAVVGVGAIGGYFGARLAEAGRHDVVLCSRRPLDGLVLEHATGTLRVDPPVLTEPAQVHGPVDWVLLATKAHQTESTAGWLDALVGPDTSVAVLQNGVDHVERVQPLVRGSLVVPTVVYCGVEVVGPGHLVHRTNGFLVVDDAPGGHALVELFDGAVGADVRVVDLWLSAAWTKLTANVVANGITALTGRRMEVFRRSDVRAQARALAAECVDVAAAEGGPVDPSYPQALVDGLAAMPCEAGTSMLYDRLAGRPLEWDVLHGAVVRAADRHGLPVPRHRMLAAVLAALSDTATQP